MERLRGAAAILIVLVMATTLGVWGAEQVEASADDSNTSEFIILGNAHYDHWATDFRNLTYEDANAFYDILKSHNWTCRDYKAHDTTDRGDSYYGGHSASAEAHDPNASGTRPQAVAEEILSTDFYGDLSDEADSADLFYFMGHGVKTAYGKYGICCLHKYNVSSPSPTNQYFSPQDVGNSWSNDLEWGVLGCCSALFYDQADPDASGAYYFANAMDDGVHGFFGYKGTAPSYSADEAIAEEFLLRAFGIPQVEPAQTLREAWIGGNEWNNQNWAILLHDDNENDYLPRNWGGGGQGPDSFSRTDIYYWDAAHKTEPLPVSLSVAAGRPFPDTALPVGRVPTRLAPDEWLYTSRVPDEPVSIEPAAGVDLAQRCLQEIRPGTSDASLQPLREIRRTSLLTNQQEVVGYLVKFAQYVRGLRVAGVNGALVWVCNQGVKLARVRWFEGDAPTAVGLAIDKPEASGIALGVVDCCVGVPAQTGVELVYHRPCGPGGLRVAWEVSFDDGQRVYVDAKNGAVLP